MNNLKIRSVVLVLLSFILGWSEFVVVGVLVDISNEMKVSISLAGLLVTIFSIFYALGTPLVTSFINRNNLFKYQCILMVALILGNALAAISTTYSVLLIARIITAIVCGTLISVDLTVGNIIVPNDKKSNLIAWIFSGFSIASVLGVPISTWISSKSNWHVSFWVITLSALVIFILLLTFLPHDYSDSKGELQNKNLDGFLKGELELLKDRRILVSSLIPLFNWAGFYVVYTYLRPIFSSVLKFPASWVTGLFLLDGVISLISNQLGGTLAQKNWMQRLPKYFALGAVIMALYPWSFKNKIAGLISLLSMSLISSLVNSPVQIYLLDVAEKDYPDAVVFASSLNSIFAGLGIAVGSATGGVVVNSFDFSATGIAGACFFLTTLILTLWLGKISN